MYPPSFAGGSHAWRLTCQDDVFTASGAAAFLLMTPEHQDIEAMAITAEKARDVSGVRITLDVLTSAERQDLANSLLRAAWTAVLERPASCCSTSSWKPTTRCPPDVW
jgi:hypothetical protein